MSKNYSNQITHATKWSGLTEILSKLVSPLVNMILARILAPTAFGYIATISMIISFADVFSDAGFQKYLIQHEFKTDEELKNSTNVAFWTNFTVSFILFLTIFFFRHKLAAWVGSPELGNALALSSVNIVLVAFTSIQQARYKRDFNFKTLFYVRMGSTLIPLVFTVPMAFLMRNYWALLLGTLIVNLFNAIALTLKSSWKPKFYFNFCILKEMLSFSVWTLFESVSIWFTLYIDTFIVGKYLNEHFLGLYKTTVNMVNSYMAIITATTIPVLFSALSRYQNDDKKFKSTYYIFQQYVAFLVIPLGVGLYLFSDVITKILLGSQWLEACEFVGLWGLTSVVSIVYNSFSAEVYRSKGKPRISFAIQLFHLCFLIPIVFFAVNYGFRTLCIVRALARFQIILTSLLIMQIRFDFKIMHQLKNTLPMLISSTIMFICGYLLRNVGETMLWDVISIVLCILVYFVSVFTLFPSFRRDFINTLQVKK